MSYLGKVLVVDLTNQTTKDVEIDERIYKDYLSGYGLGARFIMDYILERRERGINEPIDPLGPENVLGIMSGLLTGTGAPFSGRWMAVAKSPLTGMWGDSNCGGDFSPRIKQSGYDGIFFLGKSPKPVYLHIDAFDSKMRDKKVELLDADKLWGKKDSYETEEYLLEKHGKNKRVVCIGKGGETLSRLAGIVSNRGRLAGRCGMGTVMGSKNLKALCIGGDCEVPMADKKHMDVLRLRFYRNYQKFNQVFTDRMIGWMLNKPMFAWLLRWLNSSGLMSKIQPAEMDRYEMKHWGTAGITAYAATNGDSPVKAWGGAGVVDFPADKASKISKDSLSIYEVKKYGCYDCPMVCGAECIVPSVDSKAIHRVEYETLCGFGSLILQDDVALIFKINELLNRSGLDTISCASVVSWAFDGYNSGYFTEEEIGGVLKWGDGDAALKLVYEIINNEGFGSRLHNGVAEAAKDLEPKEGIDWNPKENAVHVGKQELPMHDPRQTMAGLPLGVGYLTEPTPGRHTSTLGIPDYLREKNGNKVFKLKKSIKKKTRLHAMATFFNNAPIREYDELPKTLVKADFDHSILLEMTLKDARLFRKIYQEDGLQYVLRDSPTAEQEAQMLSIFKQAGYFTGSDLRDQSCFMDVANGLGLCADAFFDVEYDLLDFINSATGWHINGFEELLEAGRRTKTLRHSFNIIEIYADLAQQKCPKEEIIQELTQKISLNLPKKVKTPLTYGPNTGLTPPLHDSKKLYYSAMGYDPITAIPKKETLDGLQLFGVEKEFERMELYQ
ncbi:MAG: aldehyde ferredoxin oxidoreductase N-terminal domain-containing protein [Eubacteriales bacterium]